MEDEVFEIYNEQGEIISQDIRGNAHAHGYWHAVVHVWIYEYKDDDLWVYMQQRSLTKKDFAGKYDITTAGHVDVKEPKEATAIRECQEEIGLLLHPLKLQYLGDVKEAVYLPSFTDKEIAHVFLYEACDPNFTIGEEVEQIIKVKGDDFKAYAKDKRIGLCVYAIDEAKSWKISDGQVCNHASIYFEWVLKNMEKSYGNEH